MGDRPGGGGGLTGTKSGRGEGGVVKSKGGGAGGLKQWWGQMMIRGPPEKGAKSPGRLSRVRKEEMV